MEYKEFKKRMEILARFYQKQSSAGKEIEKALDANGSLMIEFGHELATSYQRMLEKAVGDESNWISYWLWECDMGKREMGWSKGGKHHPMKTLKDLWNAIQLDKEEV